MERKEFSAAGQFPQCSGRDFSDWISPPLTSDPSGMECRPKVELLVGSL